MTIFDKVYYSIMVVILVAMMINGVFAYCSPRSRSIRDMYKAIKHKNSHKR